ncbi:methylenetetrahydrofolate reductase [Arthrobacter sp. KK5.5]|uniref:methylenetetrahydrofolate reductase n=1 Tax=Arthrobacter sp. KK5.5 TaxID=3373084 RepID=UPI003EE6FBF5
MSEHNVGAAPPALSYELYPPANERAAARVFETIEALAGTNPDYVSVTSSGTPARREATIELVGHLVRNTALRPLAHLICVGESRATLDALVTRLVGLGVRGVLALRGDLPAEPDANRGELRYAGELVELIRGVERRHAASLAGGRLAVGVAAYPRRHPESPSFEHDVEVLLAKERSGANFAITQVYFERSDYTGLVEAARRAGVRIPIVPGIIPFDSVRRLTRLAAMSGVEPGRDLLHRLETADSDGERRRIGVASAVELAKGAFDDGAPGLHLYTFNDPQGSLDVVEALEISKAAPQRVPA